MRYALGCSEVELTFGLSPSACPPPHTLKPCPPPLQELLHQVGAERLLERLQPHVAAPSPDPLQAGELGAGAEPGSGRGTWVRVADLTRLSPSGLQDLGFTGAG